MLNGWKTLVFVCDGSEKEVRERRTRLYTYFDQTLSHLYWVMNASAPSLLNDLNE